MAEEKPLTLSELAKYNQDVLFPFMKENFVTKKEFESFMEIAATKDEMKEGFNKIDENFKKVFNQLKLMDDKLDDVSSVKHRVDYIETALNLPVLKNK
jgi:hypothetical protein